VWSTLKEAPPTIIIGSDLGNEGRKTTSVVDGPPSRVRSQRLPRRWGGGQGGAEEGTRQLRAMKTRARMDHSMMTRKLHLRSPPGCLGGKALGEGVASHRPAGGRAGGSGTFACFGRFDGCCDRV